MSVRRARLAVKLSLSVRYYRLKAKTEDEIIIDALEEPVEKHPTHGFKKLFHLLRSAGRLWNHKRVHRIYVLMGSDIRRKRKRRLPARVRTPHILPIECNITRGMDFMHDTLVNGESFRTSNVVDDHDRGALMIGTDTSMSAGRIVRDLEKPIE